MRNIFGRIYLMIIMKVWRYLCLFKLLNSFRFEKFLSSFFQIILFLLIKKHIYDILWSEHISFKCITTINCRLNSLFLFCSFNNFFLHCTFCNKSIHWNSFCLANSMSSICCLCIHSRIPIIIIENYWICCSQIYTQTTCSCT